MPGLGTLVNTLAIVAGGAAGLVLKRFLSTRLTDTVTHGLGLAVVMVGLWGTVSNAFTVHNSGLYAQHTFMVIIALALGALAGELINIEKRLDSLAKKCEKRFVQDDSSSTFAQGFVTASLIFCVGAMAIVGSLEDGINRNFDILFAKALLDAVIALVLASTLGKGVLLSAVPVLVYQGSLTALAVVIAPFLSDALVTQVSLVGSVLIVGIGLNILKITKIRIGNLLPAILVPIIYYIIRLFV
ncbi:MAG: DUF554 domain-containing protein [Oscillospiraceae bacterium]|jgi:hypothetical protein|nr:DUF554 domain-containing protein [Oscillospiraceae bacterium]